MWQNVVTQKIFQTNFVIPYEFNCVIENYLYKYGTQILNIPIFKIDDYLIFY